MGAISLPDAHRLTSERALTFARTAFHMLTSQQVMTDGARFQKIPCEGGSAPKTECCKTCWRPLLLVATHAPMYSQTFSNCWSLCELLVHVRSGPVEIIVLLPSNCPRLRLLDAIICWMTLQNLNPLGAAKTMPRHESASKNHMPLD